MNHNNKYKINLQRNTNVKRNKWEQRHIETAHKSVTH